MRNETERVRLMTREGWGGVVNGYSCISRSMSSSLRCAGGRVSSIGVVEDATTWFDVSVYRCRIGVGACLIFSPLDSRLLARVG